MAHVSGPTSTMPGSMFRAPEGACCDNHPDRPAVKRVQGETDSMGAEFHDLCQECIDEIKEYKNIGPCDWCKTPEVELRPRRDYDEGAAGPVYYVCEACRKKDEKRLRREAEENDDYYY